ncbi:MAG: MerR family transcriptional regulator [Deltaproteobacteria bacterium]|nr:MAG: MerR family transcriptional regulator [Deltaproteobacteria bacterium]
MTVQIPDKIYFRIGEVAEIAGVKPHVLRYWETEFPTLKPVKSKKNQRLYRRKDVELVLRLKQLLHEEGYTIAGARKCLRQKKQAPAATTQQIPLPLSEGAEKKILLETYRRLKDLRQRLAANPS